MNDCYVGSQIGSVCGIDTDKLINTETKDATDKYANVYLWYQHMYKTNCPMNNSYYIKQIQRMSALRGRGKVTINYYTIRFKSQNICPFMRTITKSIATTIKLELKLVSTMLYRCFFCEYQSMIIYSYGYKIKSNLITNYAFIALLNILFPK